MSLPELKPPSNHPEAMLIINKNYAKDLILDSDAFAFRKPSNDVPNLAGVTLHLAFAGPDLLDDLMAGAKAASVDGVQVKTITAQGVLLARQQQQKRFEEHQEVASFEKWSVSYQWMLEVTRKMATVFLSEI
jgi:hypothetical protein